MEEQKDKVLDFYYKHKRMPTFREICKLFDYKSTNSAHRLVLKLIDEGFITKSANGTLVPHRIKKEIRVLGTVEAGFPSPAQEELADMMTLDEWLINHKESTYLLKVKGESMIDAGIFEGDFVLVERTDKYKVGDIVIAEIDGEWTMKYLKKKNNEYYLEPANPNFKNIYPKDNLKVAAVVRSVIRRYG